MQKQYIHIINFACPLLYNECVPVCGRQTKSRGLAERGQEEEEEEENEQH